jgi:hypothetical protein
MSAARPGFNLLKVALSTDPICLVQRHRFDRLQENELIYVSGAVAVRTGGPRRGRVNRNYVLMRVAVMLWIHGDPTGDMTRGARVLRHPGGSQSDLEGADSYRPMKVGLSELSPKCHLEWLTARPEKSLYDGSRHECQSRRVGRRTVSRRIDRRRFTLGTPEHGKTGGPEGDHQQRWRTLIGSWGCHGTCSRSAAPPSSGRVKRGVSGADGR